MPINLRLVNETTLPDGGPVSYQLNGKRGIDIGRAAHLDWTLPDPTRYISSKHCEIRYQDDGYWLYDVSTNGTFLNGAEQRMRSPHKLRDGDRFMLGHYIVAVTIDEADRASGEHSVGSTSPPPQVPNDQELWADLGEIAPSIDTKQLRPGRENLPVNPDFLDWAADVPTPLNQSPAPAASAMAAPSLSSPATSDIDWGADSPSASPFTSQIPAPIPLQPDAAVSRSNDNAIPSVKPADDASFDDFARRLISAAGLPDDIFTRSSPEELAQQVGAVLVLVTENLMQLLSARQQAKRLARSSKHTTVEAVDNNPLKFSPSSRDALATMFGPKSSGYLDAQLAFAQAFEDLKAHQLRTYSATQHALTIILSDLDPKKIERDSEAAAGLSGLLQSRNAKLWEAYKARWEAKIGRKGGEAIEAFMQYFAEHYDGRNG
jgi:type VI secretion system protein ImpI